MPADIAYLTRIEFLLYAGGPGKGSRPLDSQGAVLGAIFSDRKFGGRTP